jgi:hypothetical protein
MVDKHGPALPNQANQAKPPSLVLPLLSMCLFLFGEIAEEGYRPQQGGTVCEMVGSAGETHRQKDGETRHVRERA